MQDNEREDDHAAGALVGGLDSFLNLMGSNDDWIDEAGEEVHDRSQNVEQKYAPLEFVLMIQANLSTVRRTYQLHPSVQRSQERMAARCACIFGRQSPGRCPQRWTKGALSYSLCHECALFLWA
jgi:hypothetical protein